MNEIIDKDLVKYQAIQTLLHGENIHQAMMTKVHHELVSGGFANYSDGVMSKNWKTDYWVLEPAVPYVAPEPIETRFEILDL